MRSELLLQKVFNSSGNGRVPLLNADELNLASSIHSVFYDEINADGGVGDLDDDAISVLSFEDKIEDMMDKFDHVVKIFDVSNKSKDKFMQNFDRWSKLCNQTIDSLRKLAEEMQKDKFNSDIARIVGGVVSAVGGVIFGLSFLTPLAAVTVPLAIAGGVSSGVGGTLFIGTTATEMVLAKKTLDKVKTAIEDEKKRFSEMATWFSEPEKIENAINSLVDYQTVTEVVEVVEELDHKSLTEDEFRQEFKLVLKDCARMMNKDQRLTDEYGKELAPVVITFIFVVCLLRRHNRIVLGSVKITQNLALSLCNLVDFGILAGALASKLAGRNVANLIAKFAIGEVLACLGIFIDIISIVVTAIDLHKRPDTENTKKIKETADKFEKICSFIEGVYRETKKYKNPIDESQWATIIINHVPEYASLEDMKHGVQKYIPEEAWRRLKFRRLRTNGNNWTLTMHKDYSEELMELKKIKISGMNCKLTK